MHSRAEYFRRLGCEAQHRAAQTTNEKIRDAFQEVAAGGFELAVLKDRLDRQHNDQQANKS
jgi:uncharacterized protein (UPF0335 family)